MRFMVMVKANEDSEAGRMPSTGSLAAMGKFNEELVKAGVMLAGDGLHPSSKGARVRFSGRQRTVTDGPFAETKELIAGFWLWQMRSLDEAIAWLKRAPFDGDAEVEVRPVMEAEDFGAALTPELREREDRLRAEVAGQRTVQPATPMPVQPYLNFDGRCEEALDYYRKALGAEVKMLLRFADGPPPSPEGCSVMLPPGSEKKVMHAEFRIGDTTLMASDSLCRGKPNFQGFSISLTPPDDAEAKRLFDALADGGEVRQPLIETFFASSFGIVTDRFGLCWMVTVRR